MPATNLTSAQASDDSAAPCHDSGGICAADANSVLAGIDGVLELLERQSETSEPSFSAYCLLELVRGRLAAVLRDVGQR
ncbi:hypothetical protein [Cupriavidus campinensis]